MQQDAIIFSVVPEATPETTVGDIIIGALGLTGVMFIIAVALGGLCAFLLISWHRHRPPSDNHLPSVSPLTGNPESGPTAPGP